MQDFLQLLQIHDEPERGSTSPHRDFESIVVPVSIGIVALAKDALVLLRGEIRIVIVVRSGELGFAGEVDHYGLYHVSSERCPARADGAPIPTVLGLGTVRPKG